MTDEDRNVDPDEAEIRRLCTHFGLPYANLRKARIPEDIIALVPASVAREHRVIPIALRTGQPGEQTVVLAMSDPLDFFKLDSIRFEIGHPIDHALATPRAIADSLLEYYGPAEEAPNSK